MEAKKRTDLRHFIAIGITLIFLGFGALFYNSVPRLAESVRDFIISEIDGFCDWKTDNLGNIIAFKKGENKAKKRVLVDAHMDEVGFIVTSITNDVLKRCFGIFLILLAIFNIFMVFIDKNTEKKLKSNNPFYNQKI